MRFRLDTFQFCRTISVWNSKYLIESVWYWKGGVDSFGKGEDKTTVWSFCNSRQFPVSRYSILNWWYFYICLQFYTSHMCWWYPSVLSLFFYIINVFHNLFKELCKYIMYDCRLMMISICWCMSCCKMMIDIRIYVIYVSIV